MPAQPLLMASQTSAYLAVRANGHVISHATGFLGSAAKRLFLVTARHVVTGRNNDTDELLSRTGAVPDELAVRYMMPTVNGPEFEERVEPLSVAGAQNWVEHPEHGRKVDCVAIPVDRNGGLPMLPYNWHGTLGNEGAPIAYGPSDPVSVVGYPFGKSAGGLPIWATGFVASEPRFDYDALPILLIDCRSRSGQSGAPVILQRNSRLVTLENGSIVADGRPRSRFLGMYSGRINSESDIGVVWKAKAIQEILASAV